MSSHLFPPGPSSCVVDLRLSFTFNRASLRPGAFPVMGNRSFVGWFLPWSQPSAGSIPRAPAGMRAGAMVLERWKPKGCLVQWQPGSIRPHHTAECCRSGSHGFTGAEQH